MTLRSFAKFGDRMTSALKKDVRNQENFHQSTGRCQNWDFDEIVLSEVEKV